MSNAPISVTIDIRKLTMGDLKILRRWESGGANILDDEEVQGVFSRVIVEGFDAIPVTEFRAVAQGMYTALVPEKNSDTP